MKKSCKHCSAQFRGDGEFCCRGCEYVFQLIHDEGFDRYYDLKDKPLQPVGSLAFQERNDAELVQFWLSACESESGVVCEEFHLKGVSCVGCVWLVEKLFSRYDGHVRINIDPQRSRIEVEANRAFDIAGFASEIQRFGYTLRKIDSDTGSHEQVGGLGVKIGISSFLALNVMAFTLPFYFGMDDTHQFSSLLRMAIVVLSSFSVFVGGSYFIRRALKALRLGVLHIDLPIALGIVAAYSGSLVGLVFQNEHLLYFDFIALFVLLMLIGRWLQERFVERNASKGDELNPSGDNVTVFFDHGAEVKPVKSIRSGMFFNLEAGRWNPVRSRIVSGAVDFSLESINGESDPRKFVEGQIVSAGAILLSRNGVKLEALESWSASMLKRLFEIDASKQLRDGLMERVLRIYIISVLGVAFAGVLLWGTVGHDWFVGFQVFVSVLVVSCPCAIGLAYPRVNDLCAKWLQTRGVFLRLHSMWGRMRNLRKIIFDKTGTLTLETLELVDVSAVAQLTKKHKAALFGLVEDNLHPVARSLKEYLLLSDRTLSGNVDRPVPDEEIGFGVSYEWLGDLYYLGKPLVGHAQSVFTCNHEVIASFEFDETIRSGARSSIEWFEKNGKEVFVLSGDRSSRVGSLLGQLGLPRDRGVGEMTPASKARWLGRYARSEGMMIGDGANDALAFEKALCRATPVVGRGVLENHSDFFFLGNGLSGVVDVFKLASLRGRVVFEIMSLTIFYNLIVVCVSLFGMMNPLLAAVLMPVSSIITVSWAGVRLSKRKIELHCSS